MAQRNKKPAQRMVRTSVLEIANLTYTGKQVIVFSNGAWKHLWLKGREVATVPKPYTISSSMAEMKRRKLIDFKEIQK